MTANVNVTKLLFKRGNTVQNANYTGINGEITVDTQAKTLRIHDGVTAGGNVITAGGVVGAYSNTNAAAYIPVDPTITSIQANVAAANAAISAIAGIDTSLIANAATQQTQINLVNANVTAANAAIISLQNNAGAQATSINSINANLGAFQTYANTTFGTSNYGNTNVSAYLGAFNGNILPAANVTYSLGSEQFQWRDLWVSNNTIYIGNTPIRVDGGNLLINNSPIVSGPASSLVNGAATFQLFANGESRSPDTIFASNGVSIINANGAIQGGIYNSGDANFFNIGASTGRGIKFYVNEETEGPLFFANGSVNVPSNLYSAAGVIGDVSMYGGTISGTNPNWNYLTLTNQVEGYVFVQLPSDATANVANLRIHNDAGNVEIATGDGLNYNYWYFGNDGNLTIPGNINYANGTSILSGLGGAVTGNIAVGSGAIQFIANSSGDGNGYATMRLIPDIDREFWDQYLIVDPTAPGHIHIRAGGTQDNSNADLILGGENSHVRVTAGSNPPVYIKANSASWMFGVDSSLSMPTGGNLYFDSSAVSVVDGMTSIRFADTTTQTTAWTGSVDFGNTIAIGYNTGTVSQGGGAVAIGSTAGNVSQGIGAVAVGEAAGTLSQGTEGIAIGKTAGEQSQSAYSIAIGSAAAYYQQRTGAIAIGTSAGALQQGNHAIAIGTGAGSALQGNNSIILNATGSALEQTTDNTFTVKPIRNASGSTVLYYNSTTGEITYDTAGAGSYGNANVATYLPTYTGNIAANITKNGYSWNFSTDGKLTIPGTIQHTTTTSQVILTENTFRFEANAGFGGTYIEGQQTGLFLLGGDGGTTIGANGPTWYFSANGNVELATSGSNPDRGIVFGDGTFQPTAFSAANIASLNTLSNRVNQAVNVTSSPQFAGLTTTANVNLTANVRIHENLVVDGNINFIGNVTQTNITTANAVFTGDTYGFGALYAGVLGYTPLPFTVIQATSDYNDYSQINFQNLNLSANASTEWVATAGNGNDTTNYIDLGIAGGAWDGTQFNSVGTAAKANDSWLYVVGNTAAGTGGNLVLGTIQSGKRVNILTGGPGSANIYSYFDSSGLTTANVYATRYLYANGISILTGIGGTYSNTNVAGYIAGNITTGNIQVGTTMQLRGADNSIATTNGSAINIYSRVNISGSAVNVGLNVSGNLVVNQNSNAASFYGTNYFYTNGVSILSGIGGTYSNVNVEAYIGGNIGSYQIFANANAATQATGINSINANLGAFQTYANATFTGGASTYSNANVVSMLSANTAVFVGNTNSYLLQANNTQIFVGNQTGIFSGFGSSSTFSQLTNNVYYDGTGTQRYRNTQTGAHAFTMGGAGGFQFTGASTSVTGNAAAGMGLWAQISGTGISTANGLGISSAGALTTTTGILTSGASTGNLFNTVTTTINLGGSATTIAIGASAVNVQVGGSLMTGNISAGNIIAILHYGNSIGTTATYSGTVSAGTINTTNFSTANAVITGGYASGLANISVTGNATVGNLIGTTANTTIVAGTYSSTFDNVGNVVLPNVFVLGNTTAMGIAAGYAPNRPAFRIYGGTPAWWTTSNTNFKGSSIVVDYNQGGYFNSSTGVFTAPVAGLYQTTLNARIGSVNAQGQILVLKNGLNTAGNAIMMWEADTNTGTAVHFGVSTVVKLVAGDFLSANITAGNIQFDQNDSWTVTYLG